MAARAHAHARHSRPRACATLAAALLLPAAARATSSCGYGTYAQPTAGGAACAPCPEGALCTGAGPPLAQDGFWHAPGDVSVFYACAARYCLPEQPGASSNCRTGHAGVLCGICAPGYAFQGAFCAACAAGEDMRRWTRGEQAGLAIGAVLLFLGATLPLLLAPLSPHLTAAAVTLAQRVGWKLSAAAARTRALTPQVSNLNTARITDDCGGNVFASGRPTDDSDGLSPEVAADVAADVSVKLTPPLPTYVGDGAGLRMLARVRAPLRLLVDTLQIVASFQRTLRVPWPPVFYAFASRFVLLNFGFLRLPTSGCGSPGASYFATFHGITLGVTGMCAYIGAVWAAGRVAARLRDIDAAHVAAFDAAALSWLVALLNVSYAPVSQIVLGAFSCRPVAGAAWLAADLSIMCGTAAHGRYTRAAVFWIIAFVLGVPLLFLLLLLRFRIPARAAARARAARLEELWDAALAQGALLPARFSFSGRTSAAMSHDEVNALYEGLLRLPPGGGDSVPLDAKLRRLLRGCGDKAPRGDRTWAALEAESAANDPEEAAALAHARRCIGSLCEDCTVGRWWWCFVELLYRLLLTAVLPFIAPSNPAQLVAGAAIAFCAMLAAQHAVPYAARASRLASCGLHVVIVLFFYVALLLRMRVPITAGGATDGTFYGAVIGILLCAVFVGPLAALLDGPALWRAAMRREAGRTQVEGTPTFFAFADYSNTTPRASSPRGSSSFLAQPGFSHGRSMSPRGDEREDA